jgi:hypothetical protein
MTLRWRKALLCLLTIATAVNAIHRQCPSPPYGNYCRRQSAWSPTYIWQASL